MPSPEDKPPCETCKFSPCCTAFVVTITKEEYESGLYDPYVIKLTKEQKKQFKNKILTRFVLETPQLYSDTDSYFLEGSTFEPCPFLGHDYKCTIYENRPFVCRTYSCVKDTRITDEMRGA